MAGSYCWLLDQKSGGAVNQRGYTWSFQPGSLRVGRIVTWWLLPPDHCYTGLHPKRPARSSWCFLTKPQKSQSDFHCTQLIKRVTSPLRFKGRKHSPHFSMRTVARSHVDWDISSLEIKSVLQVNKWMQSAYRYALKQCC